MSSEAWHRAYSNLAWDYADKTTGFLEPGGPVPDEAVIIIGA